MNYDDGYGNRPRGVPMYGGRIGQALSDRLPPQNIEAEMGFLGSILLDPTMMERVIDWLKPEHFYRDSHRSIYEAMLRVYNRGTPPDVLMVAEDLKEHGKFEEIGGDDLLTEIVTMVPHAANGPYYGAIVEEKGRKRELIEAATDLIRDGYSDQFTADQLLEQAVERLHAVARPVPEDDELKDVWPEPIAKEGWHGVAGEFVKAIAPHSEADPCAILIQLLVSLGNVLGRKPHWYYERTRHHMNDFVCVVGRSAKAKKGTSWDHVKYLLSQIDDVWAEERIKKGLQSGHGIVGSVADAKYKGDTLIDLGVDDKRLLFVETEFGSVLTAMGWQGSTLSHMVREVWDYGNLQLTKLKDSTRATNAHVSIIGHITLDELKLRLSAVDSVNGFANRFLWACAKRSQLLPRGGNIMGVDYGPFANDIRQTVAFVRGLYDRPMQRTPEAWELWDSIYSELQTPLPGILGSVTDRGEAHILRLASIYATLDRSVLITPDHLAAGYAIWNYCVQSARVIFGGVTSPCQRREDKLLSALRECKEGLTRTEIIRKVYGSQVKKDELDAILLNLLYAGALEQVKYENRGAIRSVWRIPSRDCK